MKSHSITGDYGKTAAEICSVALLPAVLVMSAVLEIRSSALVIFCAVILSLGMFYANWEASRPALRQIVPVVVLASLAAASRIVLAVIPSVQPVTAICIIAGAAFGRREGFMTGSLAAFVSNCFLGQGMWTPWQMYSWGLIGYLAGAFFSGRHSSSVAMSNTQNASDAPIPESLGAEEERACPFGFEGARERTRSRVFNLIAVYAFGAFASYLFSFIMNTWVIVGFTQGLDLSVILGIYTASFVLDTAHAASTVIFLVLLYTPWERKLARIKMKYAQGG